MDVDVYVAFSPDTRGGSPAGVVFDAAGLSGEEMQRIAARVGAPATGFVTEVTDETVAVRFFSPLAEYGTSGHGTVAVLTALVDAGRLPCDEIRHAVEITTGSGGGPASVRRRADGRVEVMLTLEPAPLAVEEADLASVHDALGLAPDDVDGDVMVSRSDFTHLLIPAPLAAVAELRPDFAALTAACLELGIDTVAVWSGETVADDADLHTRDFCPAVGTDEAAATGTTNRAVLSHVLARAPSFFTTGEHQLTVEQGVEMGRPSRVELHARTVGGLIVDVAVGGVATPVEPVRV